ncbi:MAG: hypothetical protein M1834_008223 [Cirrosporium novae-zelandiae]|nr:MAG: hypothetical protein M1834_008223 [Cirrosporium novae-zelandiae]
MSFEHRVMQKDNNGSKQVSRRSHRKSRLGCDNCKSRRIKCDESRPACGNCIKHSIHCDFTSALQATGSASLTSFRPSVRFIPSVYQTRYASAVSSTGGRTSSSKDFPIGTSLGDQSSFGLPVADLKLLHHYSTSTSHTFGNNPSTLAFWQITLPQIGFSHHVVLDLVLAFSALHLGHFCPEQRAFYITQAEHHYMIALRVMTALLPRLNAKNFHVLYFSAVLICFCSFGRGPRPGEFIAFSDQGEPEWLILLRGVRAIIESGGNSLLAACAPPIDDHKTRLAVNRKLRPEYNVPIQKLRQFITEEMAAEDPNTQIYLHALDNLLQSFMAVYENMNEIIDDGKLYPHVFRWLYRASDNFILCLKQKQPLALVILAYFAVLLNELKSQWFINYWAEHVMSGIYNFLPEKYRAWIQWPMEQVKWAPCCKDDKDSSSSSSGSM